MNPSGRDRGSPLILALAGNPNSGKTSLFNALTGSNQIVGNWPGVTVEKKEGCARRRGRSAVVVDLPGVYSLDGLSEDETVTRDYVLSGQPDVIVDVVDASNLERSLVLTLELVEMGARVVLALNMVDEARARGIRVDAAALSRRLGVPVVETVAVRGEGADEVLAQAFAVAQGRRGGERPVPLRVDYGPVIEKELAALAGRLSGKVPARWLALRLLLGDDDLAGRLTDLPGGPEVVAAAGEAAPRLEAELGDDVRTFVAWRRFEFIRDLAAEVVSRAYDAGQRVSLSDRLDGVLTHRYLGVPILLAVMWASFKFTFAVGGPLTDLVAGFLGWLSRASEAALGAVGAGRVVTSFVVDGLLAGVGSVLVFIPPVFFLFFSLSVLEESGYMARAAYVTDRFMRSLGLGGRSFIPLVLGFGCNVPAILAARALENRRDRIVTILISPLMSCSARLPVYTLFAGAFFGARQGLVVFSLYLLGVVMAVVMAKLITHRLLPGESPEFVMELPPYRLPSLAGCLRQTWYRGEAFVRKAGTVITLGVVVMWALSSLPWGVPYAGRESLLGRVGSLVAPALAPAGFGNWESAAALLFGFLAKEFVVAALGLVHGAGEQALPILIRQHFTPLSACAFMVMALLYTPCIATVTAIKRETRSWGWTVFAVGYSLALGWGMAVALYQVGRLFGLG